MCVMKSGDLQMGAECGEGDQADIGCLLREFNVIGRDCAATGVRSLLAACNIEKLLFDGIGAAVVGIAIYRQADDNISRL